MTDDRGIEAVARRLLGMPNPHLSTKAELRFGAHGSISVVISGQDAGSWYDHENQIGGGVNELLKHKGINDLFGDRRGGRRDVTRYAYRDEEGKLLFWVCRGTPKRFWQEQPGPGQDGIRRDAAGKPTMQGARLVPYRLPDIVAARRNRNGHPPRIYLVEGEKDADKLESWGLVASCNPGGAGKWRSEYSPHFAGCDIVIIPDNDNAGRSHADQVARALAPHVESLKLITLQGLDEKGDISDWIADGGTQSTLEDIVDATPVLPTLADIAAIDQKLLSLKFWLDRDLPPPDFLLGEVLSTTSRTMLFAPTGIGKTNVGLACAVAVADGKDFLHWRGRGRPARVLYIDGEMPRRLMKQRLIDAVRRHGAIPETLFPFSREDFPDMPPLDSEAGQKYIDDIIELIGGVDLIVFDNIQSLIGGDMKEEDGWRDTLPWVRDLTRRQIGQLWIHHTGHNERQAYGTKTREWQLDTVIQLERAEDDDDADISFTLSFPKARERTPDNRSDFETAKITLRADRWESSRHSRTHQRGSVSPKGYAFLDALTNSLAKYGQIRPHSGNRPSVTMKEWQAECVNRGVLDGEKPHSARTLLPRHRLELIGAVKIICNGDFVWLL